MNWNVSRLLLVMIVIGWQSSVSCADDAPEKPQAETAPAKESPKENKQEEVADEKESDKDIYKSPTGDKVEDYIDFIKGLLSFEPKSEEEHDEHVRKAAPLLLATAEKLRKLEKDPDSEALLAARVATFRAIPGLQAEDQVRKIQQEAHQFFKTAKKDKQNFSLARMFCSILENRNSKALAIESNKTLGELFADNGNERIAKAAKMMLGAARRLDLVGKPLELKGTQLDGKKFNLESLKGKVVLVDFWATWCGPCVAEHPNVKKNYAGYKDKGFEVVGVSLDDDREALDKFIKQHKVPWITLHEEDEEARQHTPTYYGIMGIPTVILVDKEGKVVSLDVRGPNLGKALTKLLGPPAEVKTEDDEDAADEKKGAGEKQAADAPAKEKSEKK